MLKYLFLLILMIPFVFAEIRINEIMYNPEGSDNNKEFIEIYSDDPINLTNYIIQDLSSSDTLEELQFKDSNYILIVEEDFDYSSINASVYSAGATIGGNLNNDGFEIIILKDAEGNVIDTTSYFDGWGGDDNGRTICKIPDKDGLWQECLSTPGLENKETEIDYSVLEISEFLPNPEGQDDAEMPNGEWVELYNPSNNPIDLTSLVLYDSSDSNELYITDTNTYNTTIGPKEYVAVYRNKDSDFNLNDNFDVVRFYGGYPPEDSNLIDEVSYSNSESGVSFSKINEKWIKSILTPNRENQPISSDDYSVISISEFLPDPEGEDDADMPSGEWVELYNSGNEDLDLLGFEFYDNYGSSADVVVTNTTTESGTVIGAGDYLAVYMNGVSGFLNNDGFEKIKLYDLNDNLIDEVSYEGSDEGVSWSYVEERWQKSAPTLGYGNLDNSSSVQSEIRVEEIYDLGDGKAEWGDIIRVKLFVYKGNTNKNVVWIWVEDAEGNRATKKSKFAVYEKFLNYTFTYPLGIPDNCDDEFSSGIGKIVVSGLDTEDEEVLEIREKPNCKDGMKKARTKSFEYELAEFPEVIEDNSEFQSKVRLKNNKKEDLKVDIWSYVYSGKKHYVRDNDLENMETVEVKATEEKIVVLKNTVEGVGEAKSPRLKVKILKEGRKTPYDITKEVSVGKSENIKKGFDSVTGGVIYEGRGVKAERSAVFFFSGLMATLGVYSFLRKWN